MRLREFEVLKHYAYIHINLISQLDYTMTIAWGLVNNNEQ